MDLTQASQMVKWLDEERRKDKTLIAALQERLEGQAQQITRLESQLATLQQTVAALGVLPNRINDVGQGTEKLRLEIVHMLEQRDEQYRREKRELEQGRQLETGALRDEIKQIGEAIRTLPRLDERITAGQAESQRLNETLQRLGVTVTDLSTRTEERLQAVVYLEEQRRADHQRIVAIEKETPEMRKRIESFGVKIPPLEEAIQKQRIRLEEGLKPIKEFEKVVAELQAADFRRNQDVKKWSAQADEIHAEMERLREERQRFLIDYRDVQEALKRLEAFQARLETRMNELSEIQRVTSERMKRQWEEWQTAQEKDRRNWEVSMDERWREQRTTNERHHKRLEALVPMVKFHQMHLDTLWEMWRRNTSALLKAAQDEYKARNTDIETKLKTLQDKAPMEEVF